MRTLVTIGLIVLGVIAVSGFTAIVSSGHDHSGETVRSAHWADAVCGTVGAWEGDLEGLRNELRDSNFAARPSDGATGDSVEETIAVRAAVDRAIRATQDTLQEGLKRAGIPDASNGAQASTILRTWAQRTEANLRVAKAELRQKPTSPAEAFAALGPPVAALARSAVEGRAAFRRVAALDPAFASALNGSRNCRDLMREQP